MLMEKMRLIVQNFEEYRERFALWSELWVETDALSFPCPNWTDATTSVLEMWLTGMAGLLNGSASIATLHFMDGDYCIHLEKQSGSAAKATLTGPKDEMVAELTVDLLYFARQLLAAVGKLTQHYPGAPQLQSVLQAAQTLRQAMNS